MNKMIKVLKGKNIRMANVLKIGSVTEPEKLSVHDSLVGPVVELWLNR